MVSFQLITIFNDPKSNSKYRDVASLKISCQLITQSDAIVRPILIRSFAFSRASVQVTFFEFGRCNNVNRKQRQNKETTNINPAATNSSDANEDGKF